MMPEALLSTFCKAFCIVVSPRPFSTDPVVTDIGTNLVDYAGFADGGDLARAVRAIFNSGRAIAALVPISGG